MFIDGNAVPAGSRIEADLCVVGAGAAGLTLARHFSNLPLRVVLLESGGLQPDAASQSLNQGENTGLPYRPLESTRLRYFGGTTNHWAGQSVRLDPVDLAERPWVELGGWPIAYSDLERYYPEAESILELGNAPYGGAFWQQQSGHPQLELAGTDLETVVFRFSPVRFGGKYRDLIAQSGSISCYLNSNLTRFTTDATAGHVETAAVQCLGGNRFSVSARHFILAAGAIENCRLLLLSNDVRPEGLGNQHDNVGRYFMEHPNIHAGQMLWQNGAFPPLYREGLDIDGDRLKAQLVMTRTLQEREGLLNFSAFFRQLNARQLAARPELAEQVQSFIAWLADTGTENAATAGVADEVDTQLTVRLEHAPDPGNRVTLGEDQDLLGLRKVQLHLQVGEREYATYLRFRELLVRELGSSGSGRLRLNDHSEQAAWQASLGWQDHHLGGTRMHASATLGVVDADCKAHGVDNLFIAGASVFPTGGHANPTLTIVALALRLAQHLEGMVSP
jgi:choline dehydrogenase-like flavoprotein